MARIQTVLYVRLAAEGRYVRMKTFPDNTIPRVHRLSSPTPDGD